MAQLLDRDARWATTQELAEPMVALEMTKSKMCTYREHSSAQQDKSREHSSM